MRSIVGLDALGGGSEGAQGREEIAFLQVGCYPGTNVACACFSGKEGIVFVFLCFFFFSSMVGFFSCAVLVNRD